MLSIALLMLSLSAQPSPCELSDTYREELLSLSYEVFDQTEGAGWRALASRGCEMEAAQMLDAYAAAYEESLKDWQVRIITWHAGQMYAFAGESSLAIPKFRASYNPNVRPDDPVLWNEYVTATLAFFERDLAKLVQCRNQIAAGPTFDGQKANLHVVDGLIHCFDRPYRAAYACRVAESPSASSKSP